MFLTTQHLSDVLNLTFFADVQFSNPDIFYLPLYIVGLGLRIIQFFFTSSGIIYSGFQVSRYPPFFYWVQETAAFLFRTASKCKSEIRTRVGKNVSYSNPLDFIRQCQKLSGSSIQGRQDLWCQIRCSWQTWISPNPSNVLHCVSKCNCLELQKLSSRIAMEQLQNVACQCLPTYVCRMCCWTS